jgi:hypothetical protein
MGACGMVDNFGGDAVGLLDLDVFTVWCDVFCNAEELYQRWCVLNVKVA